MSGVPEERAEEEGAALPTAGAVPAADPAREGALAPVQDAGDAARDGVDMPAEPVPDTIDGPPDLALLAEAVRVTEALIFASERPVTAMMLAALMPEGVPAAAALAALAELYEGRGVTLVEVAGGWAFRTAPDLAQRLTKVVQAPRRLPRAAMEALSVVAYHQPCTRGEIEEIRGAALAQSTLEALLELGLIAPRGRREVPGRPTLWGTTPKFLEQFGLKALSDLPRKEELVTGETAPALPLEAPPPPVAEGPEAAHSDESAADEPPPAPQAP
jgi:segregation and condensation protein B